MKDKLNARQKKFAEYYAQSGNTVQSAIMAGYSENYANARAYELLGVFALFKRKAVLYYGYANS